MKRIGSQRRYTLEEEGATVFQCLEDNELVLQDKETGELSLYTLRDDFAGAVVVVDGQGYEFVRAWHVPGHFRPSGV
jgi:hypothetical protein